MKLHREIIKTLPAVIAFLENAILIWTIKNALDWIVFCIFEENGLNKKEKIRNFNEIQLAKISFQLMN